MYGTVLFFLLFGYFDVFAHPDGAPETLRSGSEITLRYGVSLPPKGEHLNKLTVMYEWKELVYAYSNPNDEKDDIKKGIYKPGNPFPVDVDVWYPPGKGKHDDPLIFVATPRVISGVPATLSTISPKQFKGNHLLEPYPSWNWNRHLEKCGKERLVSVIRVEVDKCGRLWVLDDGKIEAKRICPPQILAFDLKTNKVVHQYEIPKEQYTSISFFVEIAVDIRDFCDKDIFVYVADAVTNGIIVWDVDKGRSWRIVDKSMWPAPDWAEISVNGVCIEYMYGIVGMALTPYSPYDKKDRKLFFHPLNDVSETWVSTGDLRNHSLFTGPECFPGQLPHLKLFHTFHKERSSQCVSEAVDKNGILIYGLLSECSLACYNTKEGEFGDKKHTDTIITDPELLDFITGLKIVDNTNEKCQELWVVTDRFQKVATCTLDPKEINFRILAARVQDLVAGKRCKPQSFVL